MKTKLLTIILLALFGLSSNAQNFNPFQKNPFSLTIIPPTNGTTAFADLDGDGDLDMMSGSGNGDFYYFNNIGTASSPFFAAFKKNPFSLTIIPPTNGTTAFADLDRDGDLDMMSGSGNGDFYYFKNIGTASSPSFTAFQKNPFSLTIIPPTNGTTAFADLDGDGDLDMMSGSGNGDFYYFKNNGITGILEISKDPIIVIAYPNPFSTQTTLQSDKFFKDATLTVYNLYGQQVKQIKNISGQTITLHRDNLSSGLYFIRITQNSKVIASHKLEIID